MGQIEERGEPEFRLFESPDFTPSDSEMQRLYELAVSAEGAEKVAAAAELHNYMWGQYGDDPWDMRPDVMEAPDAFAEHLWDRARDLKRTNVDRFEAYSERVAYLRELAGFDVLAVSCMVLASLMMPSLVAAILATIAVAIAAIAIVIPLVFTALATH